MRVSGDWLTRAETQAVCALLSDAGHQALPVGGCVRNAMMGEPVADIDIATEALPARVLDLAGVAGIRAVPTGIDHGTVTLILNGIPHEVTTFRRDVSTDGRRAVVTYTDQIAQDAARRDFTMNALYCQPDGTLIDPLGGLPDAMARRVRFIGRAEDRIAEDYLRILRFFRFHAWYGRAANGIDPDGLAACAALSEGLDTLSRERVGAEMKKLLAAPDPAPAVAGMSASGVLARVLPGADVKALAPLVHLEHGLVTPDWRRRLAVLGGSDLVERLRLSRDEAKHLAVLDELVAAPPDPAVQAYRHGADVARDAALLRAVLGVADLPIDLQAQTTAGAAARFPVTAADLMPALQGAALGARLAELESRWIASGFALSREQLLA
ncbi:MAG: CCA tRNA nucleotidyltransferase [Paracoccaceae bacterium]